MAAVITLLLAMSLGACDRSSPGVGSVLQPVEVVALEEAEGDPIGQPVHVSVNAEGQIALIDRLSPGVILFTATGERQRRFGSQGTGPGEIESARLALFLPGDRIGVVGEGDQAGIFVFDMPSGAYVETIPLPRLPSSVTPIPDGFLLGMLDFGSGTSVTELTLSSRRVRAFGPIPQRYGYDEPRGPISGIFNHVFAAPMDTATVAIAFEPLSEVVLVGGDPGVHERIAIRRKHRRGTPEGLEERIREAMRRSYVEVFAQGSVVSYMVAVDEERILLVHQDLKALLPAVPEAVYMSVIDVNRREACLDVPVPANPDAPATFVWDGERLGVLQQEIDLAAREAPTVLRWYGIDLGACTWESLPPIGGA